MINIQYTGNFGTDGINVLTYGGSGVGKTPSLATAPGIIVLSSERGLLSLRSYNVPYIQINNASQLLEAYMWLRDSAEAKKYWTVALDSFSDLVEAILTERKRVEKDPRKAYGVIADLGIEWARAFRDLPRLNKIFIAKEEYTKDEATGSMYWQPMLPGKQLPQQVPYFFDETFRLCVGRDQNNKEVRYFRTRRTFNELGRDRSGMLDETEPTNYEYVFRKILGIRS